jgi:hypothetical protein
MENKRNLYLLPTEKPSRLFYNVGEALLFTDYEHYNGVNIYITSDEEIKDDEWHLHYYEGKPVISKSHNGASEYINLKAKEFGYNKIILTTDQDLIADGVQAIDDEFIEWFVNNPSCKFVEVKESSYYETIYFLKIIIPKEEPKQETLEEAAEKYAKTAEGIDIPYQNGLYYGFVEGAKWQQERLYSEEEVKQIIETTLIEYSDIVLADIPHWFEQFKKK